MDALPLIQIIVASTRDGRRGERVAAWFDGVARAREDMRTELLDLLAWDLPWYRDAVVPPRGQYREEATLRWAAKVAEADGYVLVTPEYNHGYPAPLKNALDHLYAEWNHKPVTFVTYGGSAGGVRAAEQLVQVAVELKMAPLRPQVHIPMAARIFGRRCERRGRAAPRRRGERRAAGARLVGARAARGARGGRATGQVTRQRGAAAPAAVAGPASNVSVLP
jgi:NAD(P)H-dependent FMN reductase